MESNATHPDHLYKVVSIENWEQSRQASYLCLSPFDDQFVHFAKEQQLQKVIDKFWAQSPEYMVLKIDPSKLIGKLVFEANPGGTQKYYHLYNGKIPLNAIIEATPRKQ